MKKNFTIFIAMLFTIASNVFADDKLYFADFDIEPGEEKEVSILLDNPEAEYRDLQFDLYLPEGITVAQDEDDEFLVELGSRCTKKHSVGFSYTDGHYVCMLYSTAKNPLTGNSGDILSITLKAADDVAPEILTGYFRNVSLSKTDATGPTYNEFSFDVTVGSNTPDTEQVYIKDFKMEQGETKTVDILLYNPDTEYRDLQFDLYLPEGITIAQDEDNEFLVELGSRCTKKHSVGFSYTDGHYVCMLYSTAKNPLTGNSGDILSITLKADENATPGTQKGYFRNVSFSKIDATGPTYDEFSFGITVKGDANSIEVVEADSATSNKKVFRDGVVIIIRGDKEYHINGTPLR